MPLRYRNHLIIEKATLDSNTGFWNVRAHIQYNEHIVFRDVLIAGPIGQFKTQKSAENYIFVRAKEWVNSRLEDLKAAAVIKS